jgi:hypothetical protein
VAIIIAGDLDVAQKKRPSDSSDPSSQYFGFDLLDETDHIFIQDDFVPRTPVTHGAPNHQGCDALARVHH